MRSFLTFDGKAVRWDARACARIMDMNTNLSAMPEPKAIDVETGEPVRHAQVGEMFDALPGGRYERKRTARH